MTKTDIIAAIAEPGVLTQQQAAAALDGLAAVVTCVLGEGESVKIPGIGTLEPRETGPRIGRNPRTGAEVAVAASTKVAFKASATLKKALNPSP